MQIVSQGERRSSGLLDLPPLSPKCGLPETNVLKWVERSTNGVSTSTLVQSSSKSQNETEQALHSAPDPSQLPCDSLAAGRYEAAYKDDGKVEKGLGAIRFDLGIDVNLMATRTVPPTCL